MPQIQVLDSLRSLLLQNLLHLMDSIRLAHNHVLHLPLLNTEVGKVAIPVNTRELRLQLIV